MIGPTPASPLRIGVSERRLWLGVAMAPAAWCVQGALGWLVGARICGSLSITTVRAAVALMTAVTLATAIAGTMTACRNWREVSPAGPGDDVDVANRAEFMAVGGIFVSATFIVAIVWGGLGSLMLTRCGAMR
jgi:hypothetical protein